jgi:O-6-methylguanine DNA methyltransferase
MPLQVKTFTSAQKRRWERIYDVVRRIPKGRVATYGQVAALAGLPRHARQVGYALHVLPESSKVPWHRVINAKGEVSALHPGVGPAPARDAAARARARRQRARRSRALSMGAERLTNLSVCLRSTTRSSRIDRRAFLTLRYTATPARTGVATRVEQRTVTAR